MWLLVAEPENGTYPAPPARGNGAYLTCGYEEHRRAPRAVWRVEWPGGPFDPTTACAGCGQWLTRLAREHDVPLLLTPVSASGEDRSDA